MGELVTKNDSDNGFASIPFDISILEDEGPFENGLPIVTCEKRQINHGHFESNLLILMGS